MATLTLARLRELLHYNPKTGHFTWLVQPNGRCLAGTRAGTIKPKTGYRVIKIDKKLHQAGRLAFFYMTGRWPKIADHINGNKDDNQWSNLREATKSQNAANQRQQKNKILPKGVHYRFGNYYARIKVNQQQFSLGQFNSADEAHAAYMAAARKFFGKFARSC